MQDPSGLRYTPPNPIISAETSERPDTSIVPPPYVPPTPLARSVDRIWTHSGGRSPNTCALHSQYVGKITLVVLLGGRDTMASHSKADHGIGFALPAVSEHALDMHCDCGIG
jgi:hypothetical protein